MLKKILFYLYVFYLSVKYKIFIKGYISYHYHINKITHETHSFVVYGINIPKNLSLQKEKQIKNNIRKFENTFKLYIIINKI